VGPGRMSGLFRCIFEVDIDIDVKSGEYARFAFEQKDADWSVDKPVINSNKKETKNKRNSREHPWCLEKRRQTVHRVPVIPFPGEHHSLVRVSSFGTMACVLWT
jgi:hypothetical protein